MMDKAGKEGKLWISGFFDYKVTPQSGSIVSPLQLITQCTPKEKNLSQLHLVPQKCTKLTRSSSKGKETSLKEIIKKYSQVHQFGYSIGRMLPGNQQQW